MLMVSESPRVMRTEDTFIRTYTGRKFWPLDPKPEEVAIEDVAHALSLICRFTGHTYCFYSVAEHSLRVSHLVEKLALSDWRKLVGKATGEHSWARKVALWGLLHDASEAYLCDLPSPIKRAPGIRQIYKVVEAHLMESIAVHFDLTPHEPALVKDADRILLNTEMRDLMTDCIPYEGYEPLPETIYPMDAQHAEVEFMRRFEALSKAIEAERIADSLG